MESSYRTPVARQEAHSSSSGSSSDPTNSAVSSTSSSASEGAIFLYFKLFESHKLSISA